MVVRRLLAHAFEHRGRYSDYAILYRGNHQARVFETALRAQSVPYEISGGQSYLRARRDQGHRRVPAAHRQRRRRSGVHARGRRRRSAASAQTTLERLADDRRRAAREPLRRGVRAGARAAVPRAAARERCDAFCALDQRPALPRRRASRRRACSTSWCAAIGYEDWLASTLDKRDAQRAHARACAISSTGWRAKGEADRKNLLELTQMIALITMLEGRDGRGRRRGAPVHAARGEGPRVSARASSSGWRKGILPHRESIDAGNVDEERRLMYVGITRAQRACICRIAARASARAARSMRAVALHRRARAGRPALCGRAAAAGRGGARALGGNRAAEESLKALVRTKSRDARGLRARSHLTAATM